MRILHVAEAFGGGLLEMVRTLAAGTARDGHEAAIAYGRRPETPESVRDAIPAEVALFELPWTARTPRAQIAAARELRRVAADYLPDVIHLHSSFAGVVGLLAIGRRAPTVFTPHAYASRLPGQPRAAAAGYGLAERFVSRRVQLVGAVSSSEASLARELGAHHVAVVENGIPELDADPPVRGARRGRPMVVAMGRTVPQRRPRDCARILGALTAEADVSWLGGGGGSRGEDGYEALAAAGVRPTGWLPHAEVLSRLEAATAYLHWTAWDGQPLSILEAMAQDVVVVASDIEPNREVLGDEQVCADAESAIAMLRRVVGDPEYAERLRDRQRERRRHFSAARMVRDWERVYEGLSTAR